MVLGKWTDECLWTELTKVCREYQLIRNRRPSSRKFCSILLLSDSCAYFRTRSYYEGARFNDADCRTSYNVFYASRATAASRRSRLIQLTHIPSVVALIICIVGGINLTSPDISDQKQGRSMLRAGIVIFLVIYAILCVLAAYAATKFSEYPSSERRITVVVIVALVLVAPRLIWSCIAYFARTRTFNIVNGSFVVRGFMLTFEEFIIIVMYTVVGLLVPSVYKRQYESQDAIADSHDKRGDQGVEAGTGAALKNLAPDPVKDQ